MIIPKTTYSLAIKKGIEALADNDDTAYLAHRHEELLRISQFAEKKLKELSDAFKSPFSFSRIVEKSYPGGRYLFGSKMRVRQYKEFEMYAAKKVDGEWVPDMDKLIVKFAITDEMLSSVMTDSTSSMGYPVTISGALNANFPQPTSVFIDSDSQYTQTIANSDEYVAEAISRIEEVANGIQDNSVRINKDLKNTVLSANQSFRKVVGDKLDFDLSCLVEALQKDSVSVYSDVISNISAMLKDTAEIDTIQLEDKSSTEMSAFDVVIDYFMSKDTHDKVMRFCDDVRSLIHLREKGSRESHTVGTMLYSLESFFRTTGYGSSRGREFEACNGLLTMSSSGSGNMSFFGDNKDIFKFTSLTLSWGYVVSDGYGSIRYSDNVSLVKLGLTPIQYLELIQGIGTSLFVKSTLFRVMGFGTDQTEFDHAEHDKIQIPDVKDPKVADKLVALTLELDSLMKTNSQSKAKREQILELSKKITAAALQLQDERKEIFFDEGAKLKDKVIENQMADITYAFDVISTKRPDIKEKASQLLSSEVYKLEKPTK